MRPASVPLRTRVLRPLRLSRGMSLVELMVAMVIGLIGCVIIFQVFETSEGIKRTTTSGGDAQQNGVIGLYRMEHDLRNGGMGFNDLANAGCVIQANDNTRATPGFTLRMSPVSISGGANATTPDAITIFYGANNVVASSTTLSTNQVAATDSLRVTSRYGYRTGDVLVLFQPGTANCALMEVSGLPNLPSDQIDHGAATYSLDWLPGGAVNVTARFNSATFFTFPGTGANATRVYNLGNLYDTAGNHSLNGPTMPQHNTYAVTGGNLTVASGFSEDAPVTVVDNIVHLRAVYGLDDGSGSPHATVPYNTVFTAGDGRIDRWVDAATFNAVFPVPWQSIIAVRVAVVARSANAEKPSAGPGQPCDTTTSAPTWSGSAWTALGYRTELDLSANADWQCYRYKVFETTVPLRNWIWSAS